MVYSFLAKYCPDPPTPSPGGASTWDAALAGGNSPFMTAVRYGCGCGRMLQFDEDGDGSDDLFKFISIHCQWNETWSGPDPVRTCCSSKK